MSAMIRSARGTSVCVGISQLVLVTLLCGSQSLLSAGCVRRPLSGPTTPIVIQSEEWTLWVETTRRDAVTDTRCASPCETVAHAGRVAVGASELGATAPHHRAVLDVRASRGLRLGRWSHAGERTAGLVTLGIGWGFAVAGSLIVTAWAESHDYRSCTLCSAGLDTLLGWLGAVLFGTLVSVPGGILATLGDHPTYEILPGDDADEAEP